MTVRVDENIPRRTVPALRAEVHKVIDLRETSDKAADDERVWGLAQVERALPVTTDKGFVRRAEAGHHGILVVRLRRPNRERSHDRIMRAMAHFPDESWRGQTAVIRDRALSLRKAKS